MPTAWVTSGRDPRALENVQADLMAPVRARENGVPLVAANKVGFEARSVAYCGKSQIVAADGTVVALAPQDEETTIGATVAIGPSLADLAAQIPRGDAHGRRPACRRRCASRSRRTAIRSSQSLAALADAELVLDPHAHPQSSDVALVEDEAMVDPRALVAPRLEGVRLFVWHASIDAEWVVPFARTRAAELRAYVVVFDSPRRRAFAVDPDGVVVCGTFGAFELAAFTFDRARTDAWRVAPATDVRDALVRVERSLQPGGGDGERGRRRRRSRTRTSATSTGTKARAGCRSPPRRWRCSPRSRATSATCARRKRSSRRTTRSSRRRTRRTPGRSTRRVASSTTSRRPRSTKA